MSPGRLRLLLLLANLSVGVTLLYVVTLLWTLANSQN
jgi:hypothetical protein